MVNANDSIAAALRGARDAAGVGRLVACLGYRLVSPPDGVAFEDGAAAGSSAGAGGARGGIGNAGGSAAGVERRHLASGGGIQVVLAVDGDEPTERGRALRLKTLMGGGARPVLLFWPSADLLTIATTGLDGRPRALSVSTVAPRAAEIETLAELRARDDGALAALARHARALDRSALTRRFFRDFRAQRDAVSRAWLGMPATPARERDQLALLFLSRLVFLYFLQKQGHLLGRDTYLIDLLRAGVQERSEQTFFRRALEPLFFAVLNTPAALRGERARALGDLPYLNGGLFERHALERAHPSLDLPDAVVVGVFESLLERYRFTASEPSGRGEADGGAGGGRHGIQPEMLGRMFEGLMAADQRGATGTFYTPSAVVDRIVRGALQGYLAGRPGMDWRAAGLLLRETAPRYGRRRATAPRRDGPASPRVGRDRPDLLGAVRGLRVLDPACGSGAFVLGSLDRLARLRRTLGDRASDAEIRRDLASNALHGVDVEPDAALLCALRLWLALTPGSGAPEGGVRPLPNLDHRVRQGDALLDPMDLAGRGDVAADVWRAAALDGRVRRARRVMAALVRRYASAAASERAVLRVRLARCELRLARRWIEAALERLAAARRALHTRARRRDLFGARDPDRRGLRAEAARLRRGIAELRRLARRLRDEATLPFFSFSVHFGAAGAGCPSAGFDLVVSNPPWVRSHGWPRAFSGLMRSRYRVCRDAGWRPSGAAGRAAGGGQVDLALLFVERGLDLLRPGGVLALLLPSKSFRSLSAGAARALVAERSAVLALEDHALDHRAIFRADAFAGALFARRLPDRDGDATRALAAPAAATADAAADGLVRIAMTHRRSPPLRFATMRRDLPLDPGDARSPWLIVPPDVRRALRAMQSSGRPISGCPELTPRRGAMTGANELLLFERAERKLGDAVVAWPPSSDADGATAADRARSVLLRVGDLCPVVRGAGIRAFRYGCDGWVAWCHDDATAAPRPPSRRLARHLAPMQRQLRGRTGWRPGLPDGVLFRLDRAMLSPRVAWRDIASDLEVVRLPARAPCLGTERPLIALNTVYFFPLADEQTALALTALLSSLPCRVFARSIAERAKDARFRFLAWTVGALPLPLAWRDPDSTRRLADLAERAHALAAGGDAPPGELRAEIDELARTLAGLSKAAFEALARFDEWLSGSATRHTQEAGR